MYTRSSVRSHNYVIEALKSRSPQSGSFQDSTLDSDHHCPLFPLDCIDGENCNMEIYEVAGSTWQTDAARELYAREVGAFVIVFSLNSRDSYASVDACVQFILQKGPQRAVPLLIIANKSDLTGTAARQVSEIETSQLSAAFGCSVIETSAKDNVNVEEAFFTAVRLARAANRARDAPRRKGGCCIQ